MIRLNKKHITQIYEKCLNLIKKKPAGFVVFKKLKYCGWCKPDEDILEVDYRKDMLRTAYHECIHYLYPDWCETQVLYAESRLINNCSNLDNAKFLKHLSFKFYKSALTESRAKKRKSKNASRD